MMRILFVILSLIILPVASPAQTFLNYGDLGYPLPTGVRSWGMGDSGGADRSDHENIYFNPAIAGTFKSAFFGGGSNTFTIPGTRFFAERKIDFWNVRASGGYRFPLGDSFEIGVGGSINYMELDFIDIRATGGTLGVGLDFKKKIYGAIGMTAQREKWEVSRAIFLPGGPGPTEYDTYDYGVLLGATFGDEWKFKPAASWSLLDFNTSVSSDSRRHHQNLGVSLRLESPELDRYAVGPGTGNPILAVTANADVKDFKDANDAVRFGIEIAIASVYYMRWGRAEISGNTEDTRDTIGFGLGIKLRQFLLRGDFANNNLFRDGSSNRFGGVVGFFF